MTGVIWAVDSKVKTKAHQVQKKFPCVRRLLKPHDQHLRKGNEQIILHLYYMHT